MENLTRTKIHENAMICIFQYIFYKTYNKEITNPKKIDEIIQDFMEINFDDCDPFFKAIIFETIKNEKEYISLIESYLKKWKFNRLCLTDQAILLTFTSEIINKREEIQVIIDMAVDLAHKYCDEKSYRYINGVLDNIAKQYE